MKSEETEWQLRRKIDKIENQKRKSKIAKILKLVSTKDLLKDNKFYVLSHGTNLDYVSKYGVCPRITLCMKDKKSELSKKLGITNDQYYVEYNDIFVMIHSCQEHIYVVLSAGEDKYAKIKDKIVEEFGVITDGISKTAMPEFIINAKKTLDHLGVVVGGLNGQLYYNAFKIHAKNLIEELKRLERENKKNKMLCRIVNFFFK